MLEVRDIDLALISKILEQNLPKDAAVIVFGSRVTGKARRGSDLDLAVDLGRIMTLRERSLIENAFIESLLPYSVDVVDFQSIDETFRNIIRNEGSIFPGFGSARRSKR